MRSSTYIANLPTGLIFGRMFPLKGSLVTSYCVFTALLKAARINTPRAAEATHY